MLSYFFYYNDFCLTFVDRERKFLAVYKYLATLVLVLVIFRSWSQPENKGWQFLQWGMSEKEVETTVRQLTQQSPTWQANTLSFEYEGTGITCYFEKGLSRVVEKQAFQYADSAQAAQAFDNYYFLLAERLGEAITIHHKASCSKIVSWKFGSTRIKLLFTYASGTAHIATHSNQLQIEMSYWNENID